MTEIAESQRDQRLMIGRINAGMWGKESNGLLSEVVRGLPARINFKRRN
jgi:hypothetical protein